MNEIINAVTKFRQSEETLIKMTEYAFGKKINYFYAKELSGGNCNAVYLIETNNEKMVLKIAPNESAEIMSHERNVIATEAEMLRLFNKNLDILIPKLICYDDSRTICKSPYIFISFLKGKPLMGLEPYPDEESISKIKYEIGVISRKICSFNAGHFGIPSMPETYTDNNCDFLLTLFRMLLDDAKNKSIEVPDITYDELLTLIESKRDILNEVKSPCYIHTDTWDGNVLVQDNRFTGLIDFEAVLYGDPLMSHDFHDFSLEPRIDFLEGYEKTTFTESEKIRIVIYKIWQRLGMIVERGYRGYEDSGMFSWVIDEFIKEVKALKEYC